MEVPREFREAVEMAESRGRAGELALLEEEAERFGRKWAEAGLRLVRASQIELVALETARVDLTERKPAGSMPEVTVKPVVPVPAKVLVFTGHRVDAPDRESPRFPAAAETKARSMIREAIERELDGVEGEVWAYAGGASGGDILFHEACLDLGVKGHLLLAARSDVFAARSVQSSGEGWMKRFRALEERLADRLWILDPDLELPRWLQDEALQGEGGYSVWQRNNLWILLSALAHGPARCTLIALWDRGPGDGPGGTQDMVERAESRGARTVILDTRDLIDG